MVLRQPVARVWGHQERLLTIARQEVHSHALKCLNLLGRTPVCATPTTTSKGQRSRVDHDCFTERCSGLEDRRPPRWSSSIPLVCSPAAQTLGWPGKQEHGIAAA